jgi:hypothetical protein
VVSNSSRSRSIFVRYLVLADRTMISISLELPPDNSSSVEAFEVLESYRGGGGVMVVEVELARLAIGRPVRELLRSLRSFAGLFLRPNMLRFGTVVGAGIRAASSSFLRCGDGTPALRSLTLARRINLPVPRLTLLHMLFRGLSFSSSS